MTSILRLKNTEARSFFLKSESYCNVELPNYLNFNKLLRNTGLALNGKKLNELSLQVRDYEKVNHPMLSNKDGKYAWRPLELIHPALYVSLVSIITEKANWDKILFRFQKFSSLKNFECLSIPIRSKTKKRSDKAVQILKWWEKVETASISLALDYNYVFHADISDCYASIYTHSIAWALHGRSEAKKKENRKNTKLLGNQIDSHIQDMRHGQTNGIPQGSVLMDFIAEMVLGYADELLSERLKTENDFKVLRYRDDYRIFVKNVSTGEVILKHLTEVLIELGLKLNASKTTGNQSVVGSSIKKDKQSFFRKQQTNKNLRKSLFLLHMHGLDFPNSGSLMTALSKFHKRLLKFKKIYTPIPLISIAVDIAYNSPRTFPFCAAIVSTLIPFVKKNQRVEILEKIHRKLFQLPNVGHMEIWLQRISHQSVANIQFKESICKLVDGVKIDIWNNEWISSKLLKFAIKPELIVNKTKLKTMKSIIQPAEIDIFLYDYDG